MNTNQISLLNQFMMATIKNLGIWMDYSNAHLIEFTPNNMRTVFIASQPLQYESLHQKADYLKRISEVILNYEGVILFGFTDAKIDLLHIIIDDLQFANVKIQIKQTPNMTEEQEHCFVRNYFLGHKQF